MLRNSFIYIFGELFSKLAPLVFLPYIASSLGADGFGQLAYYLSLTQLIYVFVGIGAHGAISRYYFRYGRRSVAIPFYSSCLIGVGIAFLFGAVGTLAGESAAFVLGALAVSNAVFSSCLTILQCQMRAALYTLVQGANAAVSILLTFLFFEVIEPEAIFRIYAMLLSGAMIALVGARLWGVSVHSLSLRRIKIGMLYIFSFGFPLIIHSLSNYVKFEFDKVALKSLLSAEELGVYALAAKLGGIVQLVLLALNKTLQPMMFAQLKANGTSLNILPYIPASIVVAFIPGCITLMVPESLFIKVFGPDFIGLKYYTVLFAFAFGWLAPYLLCVNIAFYKGHTAMISKVSLVSVVIYLALFGALSLKERVELLPLSLLVSNFFLSALIVWVTRSDLRGGRC